MTNNSIFSFPPDFEVEYKFLTVDEAGRKTGTPFQGYRSNWLYEGDDPIADGIYMIHPEFLDEDGKSFQKNRKVPAKGLARMVVVNPAKRPYHQKKIKVGTRGFFVEGNRKVAMATVTKVLGLHTNKTT